MSKQIQLEIKSHYGISHSELFYHSETKSDLNWLKLCDKLGKGSCYFLWFGILITIYTTIVYSIVGLVHVSESKLDDICSNSNIWSIVLSWVIITSLTLYLFVKTDKDHSLGLIVCSIIQVTIYTVLGSNELWNITSNCDKLHNKTIFIALTLIVFINIVIVTSLIILGLVLGLVYIWCFLDKEGDFCKKNCSTDTISSQELDKIDEEIGLSDNDDDDNDSINL